jgi:hypothetical protein
MMADETDVAEVTSNYCAQLAALLREEHALSDCLRTAATREERLACRVDQRGVYAQQRALMRAAAEAFARLNGWRFIYDKTFWYSTLARGGVHDSRDPRGVFEHGLHHDLFDHALYFRERDRPYRAAAIVGQPYKHVTPEAARAEAARLGLACHVPPNSLASWWVPGSTRFFCFTRPEITSVRFLPEQMVVESAGEPAHERA